MPIIAVDVPFHCHGEEVTRLVAGRLRLDPIIDDDGLFRRAASLSGMPEERFRSALYKPSRFLGVVREDRAEPAAWLRTVLAELAARDGWLLRGPCQHLVPPSITHVMKVLLTAPRDYRLRRAIDEGAKEGSARREIAGEEEARLEWTRWLLGREPWDEKLYDLVVPLHESTPERAATLIVENAAKPALNLTDASLNAAGDFRLAAAVQLELAKEGHDVDVSAKRGAVEILVKRRALRLGHLRKQLAETAARVPGVKSAEARPGPRYDEAGISFDFDADLPTKALLVDDERDYVETLSERLRTREIPSTVAFDGEEALHKVERDAPDVMVVDLRMPGIDGLEVLRRVKSTHPNTEVIILTGHGSNEEEELAVQLGAFAYLRKPVDIELLSDTMREAYRKAASENRKDG